MATYEIVGPDGNKYQVVGPEGASQDDVIKYVQTQMQGGQSVRKTSPEYPNLAGQEVDVSGGTQARAAASQIPILRNIVSPTPESQTFGQAFPKNTAANAAIGGGLLAAPAFAAAGPELLPTMAVGGTISGLDSALHGDDPGQIAINTGLGMATSTLGRAGGGGAGNLITPHPATPEHQMLVDTLQNEVPGARLSAGQRSGSEALRFTEQERGRAIDVNPEGNLQRDVTQELMTRVGHAPTLATQHEMAAALGGIGNTFNRIYSRNNLTLDPQLALDVTQAFHRYQLVQPNDRMLPIFQNIVQNSQNTGQTLQGQHYGIVRSELAAIERRQGADAADAQNSMMAGQLREALDDAYERSISNNPNTMDALDVGELRQARQQYRNFLTLEKAAAANSTAANEGYITPGALQTGLKSTEGIRSFATGRGDLSELANAYAGISRSLPHSGTPERLKSQNVDRNIALIIGGAGTGEAYQKMQDQDKQGDFGFLEPVAGGLGGYALGRGIGSAQGHMLLSPGMQRYLGNQVLTPAMQAILRALGSGAGTAATPQIEPSAKHVVDTLSGNK